MSARLDMSDVADLLELPGSQAAGLPHRPEENVVGRNLPLCPIPIGSLL
jgi:hypothetical protein